MIQYFDNKVKMPYEIHRGTDFSSMNLSYYCRGCKQQVRGIPLTEPQYRSSSSDNEAWLICRCPTQYCDLSFVIYDSINSEIRQIFPLSSFDPEKMHRAIPEKIREDIAESRRCFHANAYKAALSMSRRAVQNIVLDQIKDEGIERKKLFNQIDELFNKGLITANLKDSAHEVRHFGNFGAHPSNDSLENVTREDAEAVDNLASDLVIAIYITPWNTAQLKAKREATNH